MDFSRLKDVDKFCRVLKLDWDLTCKEGDYRFIIPSIGFSYQFVSSTFDVPELLAVIANKISERT